MASTTGPRTIRRLKKDDAAEINVTSYITDAAILLTCNVAKLTKPTAGAYTLAAPTVANEGLDLTLINGSSAAHIVTATGLILNGTSAAKNTMTFTAFPGASIRLLISGGKYIVIATNLVTVA